MFLGYHFDYNSGYLEESNLEILRLWPTDKQISQTMRHSYQLACELSEFLGMIQPENISFEANSLQVLISTHEEEVSKSNTNNHLESHNEDIESNISAAIMEASCEMKRLATEDNEDEESLSNDLFQEGRSQLDKIDQFSKSLSSLYNGDSGK